MAVKAELVREHLVGALVDAAEAAYPGAIHETVLPGIDNALSLVRSRPPGSVADEAVRLGATLSRLGYLTREAERRLFEPARAPAAWLGELLAARAMEKDAQLVVDAAVELAALEPEERPDPAHGTPSWRIPGPGGHVRHYAALETIARRAPSDADGGVRLGQGIRGVGELKRCWMLGFFLCCCVEAAPVGR